MPPFWSSHPRPQWTPPTAASLRTPWKQLANSAWAFVSRRKGEEG
jgi:hypothetical protein